MLEFSEETLPQLYEMMGEKDEAFRTIIQTHGYPPVWIRPNTYETLVLTILEQQVSLASAYSTYLKLKARIDITPANLLALSDEELRACTLTRQKTTYTRILATEMIEGRINLQAFEKEEDEVVRQKLKALKGIGDWTVDIYLLHALRRTDIFPTGDLALVNAIKMTKGLQSIPREALLEMAEAWRPYRSIATMLFWHHYIKVKKIKILH